MRRRPPRSWIVLAGLLALGGCGGGGGTPAPTPAPSPTPPPANRAPVFTSATAISIPENIAGTVYTATATDADGNALTFSLAGGCLLYTS